MSSEGKKNLSDEIEPSYTTNASIDLLNHFFQIRKQLPAATHSGDDDPFNDDTRDTFYPRICQTCFMFATFQYIISLRNLNNSQDSLI